MVSVCSDLRKHACTYAHTHTHTHNSLHFLARSPSPSSTMEVNSLPFIEHTSHSSASSSTVDNQHKPLSFTIGRFPFRRLPSEDDALTFSSLPTSQFSLKPSSMDVECQEPPSFSWQKSLLGSDFSTFNQNDREKSATLRQFGSNDYYSTSNFPIPSSTPSDIAFSGSSTMSKGASTTMQPVHSHAEPVDMSRSSLSVADSKTIILSNAPSTTPSNERLKVPSLQQQTLTQPMTRPTSLVQGQLAPQNMNSTSAAATPSVNGGVSAVNSATTSSNAQNSATSVTKRATHSSAPVTSDGSSLAQEKTEQKTSAAPTSVDMDTTSPSGNATVNETSTAETKNKVVHNVWLMNGPESSLLQLSKPPKQHLGEDTTKGGHSVFATVNSALSVTSQFQRILKKKKTFCHQIKSSM